MSKYIFVTGAPGSKWSSVVLNIYQCPAIDRSDYDEETRTYYHNPMGGSKHLMHMGAYFDPGMEFGDWFDKLDQHTKEECEAEFDRPFSGNGVRIIRSHVFAHHIDFLRENWPDCPIVLVHRNNDECLGWWIRCGHFNITYPLYDKYYVDLVKMGFIINDQNKDILEHWHSKEGTIVKNNQELAKVLKIGPTSSFQNYVEDRDIGVKVI